MNISSKCCDMLLNIWPSPCFLISNSSPTTWEEETRKDTYRALNVKTSENLEAEYQRFIHNLQQGMCVPETITINKAEVISKWMYLYTLISECVTWMIIISVLFFNLISNSYFFITFFWRPSVSMSVCNLLSEG